jgi:hypothetical protein
MPSFTVFENHHIQPIVAASALGFCEEVDTVNVLEEIFV